MARRIHAPGSRRRRQRGHNRGRHRDTGRRTVLRDCTRRHVNVDVTIEDAKVFTRPWKMSMPLYRRVEKHAQLLEYKCVEFVEELIYGHLRKKK